MYGSIVFILAKGSCRLDGKVNLDGNDYLRGNICSVSYQIWSVSDRECLLVRTKQFNRSSCGMCAY